jgi:hypothetical protein
VKGILVAVVIGLAVNECCDVCPWVASKIVRWSARQRYKDQDLAETRAEELAALIEDRPGKLLKLATALGFAAGAVAVAARQARSRHTANKVNRLAAGLGLTMGRYAIFCLGWGAFVATFLALLVSSAGVRLNTF